MTHGSVASFTVLSNMLPSVFCMHVSHSCVIVFHVNVHYRLKLNGSGHGKTHFK